MYIKYPLPCLAIKRLPCLAVSPLSCIDKIGVNENFIRIGGNSLNAISITSRLKHALELDVSIVDVFNYPESPVSHVLINHKGKFKDKTDFYFPDGGALGMISDAEQLDLNGDGKLDIIYTGEWLGMEVMVRESDRFVKKEHFFPENIYGWWNSLTTIDIDEDGDVYCKFNINMRLEVTAYYLETGLEFSKSMEVNWKIRC